MRWFAGDHTARRPGARPVRRLGSTLFAARRVGFMPTGIELEPEHHADIVARLRRMTGADGGLFAEPAPKPEQEALL
jgi:hypothetical protein